MIYRHDRTTTEEWKSTSTFANVNGFAFVDWLVGWLKLFDTNR